MDALRLPGSREKFYNAKKTFVCRDLVICIILHLTRSNPRTTNFHVQLEPCSLKAYSGKPWTKQCRAALAYSYGLWSSFTSEGKNPSPNGCSFVKHCCLCAKNRHLREWVEDSEDHCLHFGSQHCTVHSNLDIMEEVFSSLSVEYDCRANSCCRGNFNIEDERWTIGGSAMDWYGAFPIHWHQYLDGENYDLASFLCGLSCCWCRYWLNVCKS